MTPQQYKKIYDWFTARPGALAALAAADLLLPRLLFFGYPVLLVLLGFEALRGGSWFDLARAVVVPAAVFIGGSALRAKLNFPRPYEQPGFKPLADKATRGHSFPSRHALSAAVIAAAWLRFYPPVGWGMAAAALGVCVVRVLAGVHAPRDVAAGAVLGFGLGVLGMWL